MKTIRKKRKQQSAVDEVEATGIGDCVKILCPNCGSSATRKHVLQSGLVETACRTCDYFLVSCKETGNIIEAYAPGLYLN